jgi:TPR repeat protein
MAFSRACVFVAAALACGLASAAAAQAPALDADGLTDVASVRAAAERGDADAQVVLGRFYFEGRGVPQSDVEAVRWWRLAADAGHQDAQFHISFMYQFGRGVPLDIEEAIRWYELGALHGDRQAMYNLGRMYYIGQPIAQDLSEAARWWRLAAAEGDVVAQFNLGQMFGAGQGVPRDDTRAYMWLHMAVEHSTGEDWVRRITAQDEVGARLDEPARVEATARAVTCVSSNFADCGYLE